MAIAAAEGKLDEFLKNEMPDSEHARALATMMMSMTGMMPNMGSAAPAPNSGQQEVPTVGIAEPMQGTAEISEEVRVAVQAGDVKGLTGLLRQEYLKRTPGAAQDQEATEPAGVAQGMPTIDKELIDELVAIAKDNSVTLDWIILRAIKVYVEEYRKTGKL